MDGKIFLAALKEVTGIMLPVIFMILEKSEMTTVETWELIMLSDNPAENLFNKLHRVLNSLPENELTNFRFKREGEKLRLSAGAICQILLILNTLNENGMFAKLRDVMEKISNYPSNKLHSNHGDSSIENVDKRIRNYHKVLDTKVVLKSELELLNSMVVGTKRVFKIVCPVEGCHQQVEIDHYFKSNASNFDKYARHLHNEHLSPPETSKNFKMLNLANKLDEKFAAGSSGNRYFDDLELLKLWALHQFIIGGRHNFKNMMKAFPCPGITTLLLLKSKLSTPMVPSVFYPKRVMEFAQIRGYSKDFHICFDETVTLQDCCYDRKTNQILGFEPKLNIFGIPQSFSFPATQPSEVIKYFTDKTFKKSTNVLLILAVPLSKASSRPPSIPLAILPSGGSLTKELMINRLDVITKVMSLHGLVAKSIACDGLPVQFSAQKFRSRFGHIVEKFGYRFAANPLSEQLMIQDTLHLVNNLRMALYDTTRIMFVGNQPVLVRILQRLQSSPEYTKFDHCLNRSDVANTDKSFDRQNKYAALRICHDRILKLCKDDPDAQGTLFMLEIMNCIVSALTDPEETDENRLLNMTFAVSCLRRWKNFVEIQEDKNHKGFITSNSLQAVEMNYVALVSLIAQGKGSHICVMDSQHCERYFGNVRTIGTRGNSSVNFGIQEFLRRCNDMSIVQIIENKLQGKIPLSEPKKHSSRKELHKQEFPLSEQVITDTIRSAILRAETRCNNIGINCPEIDISLIYKPVDMNPEIINQDFSEELQISLTKSTVPEVEELIAEEPCDLIEYRNVKLFPDVSNSGNFRMLNDDGSITTFKKRSLIFILEDKKHRFSNDRLFGRYLTQRWCPEISYEGDDGIFKANGVAMDELVCVEKTNNGESTVFIGKISNFNKFGKKTKTESKVLSQSIIFNKSKDVEFFLFPLYLVHPDSSLEKIPSKDNFRFENYVATIEKTYVDLDALELKFDMQFLRDITQKE